MRNEVSRRIEECFEGSVRVGPIALILCRYFSLILSRTIASLSLFSFSLLTFIFAYNISNAEGSIIT